MTAKVVDASVLAAIVFGEPGSDEAVRLLENATLYAPTLLVYETAQVAVKKASAHPQLRNAIGEALDLIPLLNIKLVSVSLRDTWKTALQTGLTAYDASYLFVSRALQAQLITFDRTLSKHC